MCTKSFLVTISLLVCSSIAFALPILNEVNPTSPEWIEINNDDSSRLNLSEWYIRDNSTDNPDTITCYNLNCSLITNATYFIILGRGTNISQIINISNDTYCINSTPTDCTVGVYYTDDSKIGNGLGDSGDFVEFYTTNSTSSGNWSGGVYYTNMSYNLSQQNSSWSWNNNSWQLCFPTPGYQNNCSVSNEFNQTNQTYNLTLDACDVSMNIDAFQLYDITNDSSIDYDIHIRNTVYNGTDYNASLVYWIEDLFGSIVREPYELNITLDASENLDRTWTPDDIVGSETYIIKANASGMCNDTNMTNNYAESMISVKGYGPEYNSSINITSVDQGSSNITSWGDSFNAVLDIYRGNTSKYAVELYVIDSSGTKVSEVHSIHVRYKYYDGSFKIPVQLKAYCKGEHPDGAYTLVADGLNLTGTRNISVSGYNSNACKTIQPSCSGSGVSYVSTKTTAAKSKTTAKKTTVKTITEKKVTPESIQDIISNDTDLGESVIVFPVKNYDIVSYKSKVYVGEDFETVLSLNNYGNDTRRVLIYSYVQDGNKLLSRGWDGTGWKKDWDANKRIVFIAPNSSQLVSLKNMINGTVASDVYALKVKIKEDNDTETIEKDLELVSNITYDDLFRFNVTCTPGPDGVRILSRSFSESMLFILSENNTRTAVLEPNKELILRDGYYFLIMKPDSIISSCSVGENSAAAEVKEEQGLNPLAAILRFLWLRQ